jgi:hypothetical protein
MFTGMCKYLEELKRRSAREGWKFGMVARIETAPAAPKQERSNLLRWQD